jgi:S1-C subfamily serine protease
MKWSVRIGRPVTRLLPRSSASRIAAPLLALAALAGGGARAEDPPPPHVAGCRLPVPDLYQRVSPAVVSITSTSINPYDTLDRMQRQAGSGVLIDPKGLVLTNSHVVFGQSIIAVTLDDGQTLPAEVVGADPLFDVAVMRVQNAGSAPLPAAALGESATLAVGDEVFAIGNPFGLEQTLTRGIVSAMNRILPGSSWSVREPMIQTDAAINHGNSGGPLVDHCGKVVGINTAILPEAQGIGFAIPIDLVKGILPDLLSKGRVVRPWIGIQGQFVLPPLRELLRLPLAEGFLVEVVEPDSPAGKAGVRGGDLDLIIAGEPVLLGGDVISEINGTAVDDPERLDAVLKSLAIGETVRLKLFRGKEGRDVSLVVAERPLLPRDLAPRQTALPAGAKAPASRLAGPPSTRRAF